MKKWLIIEIFIFAALIILAISVCANLTQQTAAPGPVSGNTTGADQTTPNAPDQTTGTAAPTTEPAPTWMTFPATRALTAQQYFVYDCDADTFLTISGSENDRIYPASVTKLFTAYVAMQFLEPDTPITAGDVLDLVYPGSSVAELKKGEVYTASLLVEGMLLPSGNDAAYVLAEAAGKKILGSSGASYRESVDAFMKEMNRQAKDVGMTGTNFVNPDGIHEDTHYSTFRDLATLGAMCAKEDTILKNAQISMDTILVSEAGVATQAQAGQTVVGSSDKVKHWKNTNALIDPESKYYCPYTTGLKTGQTPSAGSCLLSSFSCPEGNYIIGVFGCPDVETRFADTLQLFNNTIGN